MKRALIIVAASLNLATLGGCAATTGAPATILASDNTGISVSGEGEARGKPDIAVLRLGVEATRPSMEEARAASAAAQSRIMVVLKNNGVADADVVTEHLTFAPQYHYAEQGRTLRGYTATNIVRVTVRDLSKVSGIVDGAAKAGDNDVRVDGLSFEVSDPAPLRAEARKQALEDAKAKAKQLAEGLGVDIGEPLAIEETSYSAPTPIFMPAAKMMEASDSTPIAAGTVDARVSVRVRWAISRG